MAVKTGTIHEPDYSFHAGSLQRMNAQKNNALKSLITLLLHKAVRTQVNANATTKEKDACKRFTLKTVCVRRENVIVTTDVVSQSSDGSYYRDKTYARIVHSSLCNRPPNGVPKCQSKPHRQQEIKTSAHSPCIKESKDHYSCDSCTIFVENELHRQ